MCYLPYSSILILNYFSFFFLKSTLSWSFEGKWKMYKIDAYQVCCKEKQVWLYWERTRRWHRDKERCRWREGLSDFWQLSISCLLKSLLRHIFLPLFCFISGAEGLINPASQFMALSTPWCETPSCFMNVCMYLTT